LTSCKKEEVLDSNQLGEATINGNLFAHIDETNDVDANGNYIQNLTPENLEGVAVTVTINTMSWDQSPDVNYDYPEKTYSTVTDADGNYTLTIPCTDAGFVNQFGNAVDVEVEFGTKIVTYKEYSPTGEDLSRQIEINQTSQYIDLRAGMVVDTRHEATSWDPVSGSSTEFGSSTLRLVYQVDWDYTNAGLDTLTGSSLIGKTISLEYNSGPSELNGNIYTALVAVDANNPTLAIAEFTVPTYSAGNGSSYMNILTPDFQGVRVYNNGSDDVTQNCIWNFGANSYYTGTALADGAIETVFLYNYGSNGRFTFNDN
jgi:hypothetical protein